MSNESQREIFRTLRETQNRYTYFLLAVAGAAIGFALTRTQDVGLMWRQVPLGLGVLSWGGSFFCGCQYLRYVQSTLYANAEMLRIGAGVHPQVGNHPQYIQAASEGIRQAIECNSEAANQHGHWQFRLLIIGAICYIFWHVLEMSLRPIT